MESEEILNLATSGTEEGETKFTRAFYKITDTKYRFELIFILLSILYTVKNPIYLLTFDIFSNLYYKSNQN